RGVNFYGLSLDTTNNRLYTVDPAGEVHVFNNASTRSGTTTPDRTVTPDLGTFMVVTTFGIAVDKTRDLLYVGIAPNPANPIFVDRSRNKLYAVGNNPNFPNNQSVLNIVDNASTADEPNVTGISVFLTATNIRLSAVAVKP